MKQRMRRISALLLVALMCVSCMVPAFAAENEGCPGVGAIHTTSNCEYEQIGEPHEASCGVQGYTTYQCIACKAYFAGDFVDSASDHVWQTVRQLGTCTEAGFYKQVCLNCDEERDLVTDDNKEYYEVQGHIWVAANGTNCEDGVSCRVCGVEAEEIADEFHVWGEPELTDAPTHKTNGSIDVGSAKFTCTVCGEVKVVDVYCSGEHKYQIDYKKYASCTETGAEAGATCLICGLKVHFEKKDTCDGWTECTIRGCDHGSTEGCGFVMNCQNHSNECLTFKAHSSCGTDCTAEPYAVIEATDHEKSLEWIVDAPTCTEAGSAYQACTMCEQPIGTPTVLDPLGHNYQTKIYRVSTTGGLTAEQIAMFDGMAEGLKSTATSTVTHTYSFYVEDENGELKLETATATIPVVRDGDAALTPAPENSGSGSTDTTTPAPTTYVWTGEYEYDDPLTMDAGKNIYMHWGENCSTSTTFWSYVCIDCNYRDVEASSSFVGHYWVEDTADDRNETASCTGETMVDAVVVYKCANPNCDGVLSDRDKNETNTETGVSTVYVNTPLAEDDTYYNNDTVATKIVTTETKHLYVSDTVLPTCVSKGYTIDKCMCGAIDYTKAAEGYGEGSTNTDAPAGAYDIKDVDLEAHLETDNILVAVTCFTDGKKDVYCSREGCVYTKQNPLQTYVMITATGAHTKGDFWKQDDAANCLHAQYAYYKCAVEGCGYVFTEELAPKKDHSYEAEPVKPNCLQQQAGGYTVMRCKNGCNQLSPETASPVEFDETNPAHHTSWSVTSVIVGNCDKKDEVRYICTACGDDWRVWEDFVGPETIDGETITFTAGQGAGHTWTKQNASKATCVVDGNIEYYYCSNENCTALALDAEGTTPTTLEEVTLPKLSETGDHPKEDGVIVYKGVANAPTCTKAGNTAGLYCTVCDEWVNDQTVLPALNHGGEYDTEGTYWTLVGERAASCTKWGYKWYKCSECDAEKLVEYEGTWTENGEHNLATRNDAVVPTCCSIGYTASQHCTVCGITIVERQEIAKAPHVNADDEEFYGICTDTVENRECVYCKEGKYIHKYLDENGEEQTVEIAIENCDGNHDDDADTVNVPNFTVTYPTADAEKLAQGAHSWIVTEVAPTCMSYSYTLIVCEHCYYSFMTDEGFEYSAEHAWGDWYTEEEATYISTGLKVRECSVCHKEEEAVIPQLVGLFVEAELENAVKPGAALPDNGLVNLVVNTNASDLDVWGIRLELTYTGKVDLVKDENGDIKIVSKNEKFEHVEVNVDEATNKIVIVATAPNGADGKLADVNLNGLENLITIQFKLDGAVAGADSVTVSAGSIFEVTDKNQNKMGREFVEDENGNLDKIDVVATSGDVTGNGVIDIYDAKALMLYITGESDEDYNSAADIDQDGEVTLADYAEIIESLLG